jgi:hypothetical protein
MENIKAIQIERDNRAAQYREARAALRPFFSARKRRSLIIGGGQKHLERLHVPTLLYRAQRLLDTVRRPLPDYLEGADCGAQDAYFAICASRRAYAGRLIRLAGTLLSE